MSLGLRLAANIVAGHLLLNILSGFTYNIMTSGLILFIVGMLPLAFIVAKYKKYIENNGYYHQTSVSEAGLSKNNRLLVESVIKENPDSTACKAFTASIPANLARGSSGGQNN